MGRAGMGRRGSIDLGAVSAAARTAAEEGLRKAAEHVLQESRRLVPLEEGALERSGKVSVDGLKAAVSYATKYAARQHEELTWRHANGRQAKYLEQPLNTEAATCSAIIAAEIKAVL